MYLSNKFEDFLKRRYITFKYFKNQKHWCSCAPNLLENTAKEAHIQTMRESRVHRQRREFCVATVKNMPIYTLQKSLTLQRTIARAAT
jgi:hypothetical protein